MSDIERTATAKKGLGFNSKSSPWSGASFRYIGYSAKQVWNALHAVSDDTNRKVSTMCAMILATETWRANADTLSVNVEGLTNKGEMTGSWKVTVERIASPDEVEFKGEQDTKFVPTKAEFDIAGDFADMSTRLSSGWGFIKTGLAAIFKGSFQFTVTKDLKFTRINIAEEHEDVKAD